MSSTTPTAGAQSAAAHDALLAIRNAVKLGGSLACTWGIALGARLLLPRYLGPEAFGPLNLADALTTALFVVLGLGLDTYIRKEIPVRPGHASEFFGGFVLLRLALSGVVFAAMAVVLRWTNRPPEVALLFYAFGVAQVFVAGNTSLSALLHARGTVDGLSIGNVVTKLVWGAGILVTLVLDLNLVGIPLALVASEALKSSILWVLVKRNLGLRLSLSLKGTGAVVLGALPFYLNVVAHTVYNKLDVSFLAVVADDREVGWYGAASMLAGISMMITPMLGWVMMPLFARARARSVEEFTGVLRRALELILAVAIPTSLMMGVGADLWITLVFGEAFAPASLALRFLAPLFLLTYVAMVSAICLNIERRAWTVTFISMGGLLVNPLLNWALIVPSMRFFGPAGGGAGCALAQLGTEALVTGVMTAFLGRRAFDRRTLMMILKAAIACAAVVQLDRLLVTLGLWRIILDGLTYCVLFVALRAMPLKETFEFAFGAFRRRHDAAPG